MEFSPSCKIAGKNPAIYFSRLSHAVILEADLKRLHCVISDTSGIYGRSKSFRLSGRLVTDRFAYLGLRCKGITPSLEPGTNRVQMYMGSGHDPYNVDVGDRGELIVSAADLSPSGTTTVEKARRELEVADDLGEDLADYPLGFGIYENFAFMGGTVGFAVFAMRAPDDSRLFQDFVYPILNVGKAIGITPMRALQSNEIEAEIVFSKFGATLAKMHRRGYVHTTPHLNNVGLIGVGDFEVVMRDLSAAKKLAEMTPEQRVGYLMLDLGRVMRSLYRRRNFNGENYSLSLSVQPFMLGYMGDQLGINPEDFRQLMEPFSVVDRSLTGERVMGFNVYRWAMANRAFGIRELLEYIQYMICK